jgi:hypothetical protein
MPSIGFFVCFKKGNSCLNSILFINVIYLIDEQTIRIFIKTNIRTVEGGGN